MFDLSARIAVTEESRNSSWSLSQELEEQKATFRKNAADSENQTLSLSREMATQRTMLQDNASWMQRLFDLLHK